MIYQNYHKHTHASNIFTADSPSTISCFAKRAKELGHGILSTVEHGFQGLYFDAYEVAKEHNLKFVYGSEVYWVKNRLEKDKTNAHMIILARNNEGRKALNRAISTANEDGYYYKPRLDMELIMGLPKDDVFITTACIAGWLYDDSEEIFKRIYDRFGDNFMLEVQYHPMKLQCDINERALKLARETGIDLIAGMDSHFIRPEQKGDRDEVLKYRGIIYENEEEFHMDYPDYDTAFQRFDEQAVLDEKTIHLALANTNKILEFEDYDDVDIFSKDIKLPTLYPSWTQEQKDKHLAKIVQKHWKEFAKTVPVKKHQLYKDEIKREFDIITETKMTDYFLLDYEVVREAVKTFGGNPPHPRGSGGSFFINTLLGFSKLDRVSAPVKMFPTRFMSKSRILETKSLPDLDLNLSNQEPMALAQKKLLGEHNSYPMIAFGTFKAKSAWKMYAKVAEINFSIANDVSKQIQKYEKDLAHVGEDERDTISIYDYIQPEYHDIYNNSLIYQGIISDKKPHPCAYLIYDKDIREEIGLIRVKSESSKKETIVCLMDGNAAERYKFLKNDLLKVDVVHFFYEISKKIKKNIPSERELIELTNDNQKVWNIYKNGLTLGVNQVEKDGTKEKVMKYAPQNIAEICAFIAAIRPSFRSMYSIFESREYFEYGIPSFDKLIQSTGLDSSFMLYQETIMAVLAFAGFPEDETYSIIKWVSKKKQDKIAQIKPKLMNGLIDIFVRDDGMARQDAEESANKVWRIIEDASRYGFNASHSYSYAYDSLLCAYYKSHYPLEFYDVLLQEYTTKGNKDKVALLIDEMKRGFGISTNPIAFGEDNRRFSINYETKTMNQSIVSWKGISQKVANQLYDLGKRQYDTFYDLYVDIKSSNINSAQLNTLVKLDYFTQFGKSQQLLQFIKIFDEFKDAKVIFKNKYPESVREVIAKYSIQTDKQYRELDNEKIIAELTSKVKIKDISIKDKLIVENDILGRPHTIVPQTKKSYAFVCDIVKYGKHPIATLYRVNSGEMERIKIKIDNFNKNQFEKHDIIETIEKQEQGRWKKDDKGWYQDWDDKEDVLISYRKVG